jgi:hypothetical protein
VLILHLGRSFWGDSTSVWLKALYSRSAPSTFLVLFFFLNSHFLPKGGIGLRYCYLYLHVVCVVEITGINHHAQPGHTGLLQTSTSTLSKISLYAHPDFRQVSKKEAALSPSSKKPAVPSCSYWELCSFQKWPESSGPILCTIKKDFGSLFSGVLL